MRLHAIACCALLAASPVSADMLFDFGRTNLQSPAPPNVPTWNNVVPATTELFAIFDDSGAIVPGVTFAITDTFFQTGEPSSGGSESPSGDAAAFPVSATDDYFFGHTGAFAGADDNPYGEFTLSGLDLATPYSFTFFSSRTGVTDNRETAYTVTGASAASGVAVTSGNDSEVLNLSNILPDANGEISIGVSAGPNNDNGNGFFYVNLMQVSTAIPEPTAAVLAIVAGLGLVGRRVRS